MGLSFVAIDFETANSDANSACSVGLAIVRHSEIIRTVYRLIRPPTRRFSPYNFNVHHIAWEDVREAPDFRDVWFELRPLLEDAVLVAHSAPFEQRVLQGCFEHFHIRPSRNDFACTVRLTKHVLGFEHASLSYVCRRLEIPLSHHHAESDAAACAQIALRVAAQGDIRTAQGLVRASRV